MDEQYKFKDGDRVFYDLQDGVHSGTASVIGCSTIGVAILGKTYIIVPDLSIKSEYYPFQACACFESQMKLI